MKSGDNQQSKEAIPCAKPIKSCSLKMSLYPCRQMDNICELEEVILSQHICMAKVTIGSGTRELMKKRLASLLDTLEMSRKDWLVLGLKCMNNLLTQRKQASCSLNKITYSN